MFDFNSDGVEEIVYRDESLLRVINGSGKSHITGNDTIKNGQRIAYNLASVGLKSPTKSEVARQQKVTLTNSNPKWFWLCRNAEPFLLQRVKIVQCYLPENCNVNLYF